MEMLLVCTELLMYCTYHAVAGENASPWRVGPGCVRCQRTGRRCDVTHNTTSFSQGDIIQAGLDRRLSPVLILKRCKINALVFQVETNVGDKYLLGVHTGAVALLLCFSPGSSCGRWAIASHRPSTQQRPTADPELPLAGPPPGALQTPVKPTPRGSDGACSESEKKP